MEKSSQNIHMTVEGNELTIRQGDALPARAPKSIAIEGVLGAPMQFLVGKPQCNQAESHIKIDQAGGRIILVVQDTDAHTTHTITGSLKRDSVLGQFQLNTDKRWETQEFLRFIKTMRYYFPDKEEHKNIVESLMKWSAQINTVLNENQDTKGNSRFELERKVSNVPLKNKFTISVPIFQGYPAQTFDVEIGLDPKALQVDIFLISDDLIELEIGQREKLIKDELAKLEFFNCSKVFVS